MEYLTGKKRRSSTFDSNASTSSSSSSVNSESKRSKYDPRLGIDHNKSKVSFIPDLYKQENARRIPTEEPDPDFPISEIPSDTKAALLYIRNMFPIDAFHDRLPPIILQSQLGTIVSKTSVLNSQLKKLVADGEILLFSNAISGGASNFIVFYKDFVEIQREGIYERFVKQVLAQKPTDPGSSVDEEGSSLTNPFTFRRILKDDLMKKWRFRENDVRLLVNSGYLGICQPGQYCLSLPGAGLFMKVYKQGEKTIISAIKRSKYGTVMQNDFEKREMRKTVPLGIKYHIHDMIGTGTLERSETTSGPLLRIKGKRN